LSIGLPSFSSFSKFIRDQELDSNQLEFVHLIVNHIVANGYIEKSDLNQHPFNRNGNIIDLFCGKVDIAKNIVNTIDQFNARVAV